MNNSLSVAFRRAALAGLLGVGLVARAQTQPLPPPAVNLPDPTNVANGQTSQQNSPSTVQNLGTATIQPGGKAVFIGGQSVILKPGFSAFSGSQFRASQDLNLGGFANLTDSDFDGLPDEWEKLHFGPVLTTTTGSFDSDGDGLSNADEYKAGTDPNIKESDLPATLASGLRVILKTPTGKFLKVLDNDNWSIATAP